jgi:hypothetical protein
MNKAQLEREAEMKRKEAEMKRKEAEMKRKEAEMKKKEAEYDSKNGSGSWQIKLRKDEQERAAIEEQERKEREEQRRKNFNSVVTISREYDCFGPYGNVNLISGLSKIYEIKVGDHIQTLNGFNKVVNITKNNKTIREICIINNVVLTNRHPIKLNNEWCYPEDKTTIEKMELEVYNFELLYHENNHNEGDHTIIVDGLICATLGCGPKIAHAKPSADIKYGSGYWKQKTK